MTSVLHDAGIGVDRGYLRDRRHRARPTGGDGERRGGAYGASELRLTDSDLDVSIQWAAIQWVRHLDGRIRSSWSPLDWSNSPMNRPITR